VQDEKTEFLVGSEKEKGSQWLGCTGDTHGFIKTYRCCGERRKEMKAKREKGRERRKTVRRL